MGKFDEQRILVLARVVEAELKQPLQKNQKDIPAFEGLLARALATRKPRKDVEPFGARIVRAQHRVAFYTALFDAITQIKNSASILCDAAVRDKTPPPDVAGAFQVLCCAAECLPHPSLAQFRREIACGLYHKVTIDRIAKRDQLDEEVRKGLLDEQPSEDEVLQVLTTFCEAHVDLQPQLESVLGITIQRVPEIPTGPPVIPSGQPVVPGAPPATAPVFQPGRPVAPPAQQAPYRKNDSLIVPLALPPFPRERWQALLQQVHEAAA
jgi:hypothetical protein